MELLRVREHEVATYLWGEGHNVLLLHGWNGRAAQLGAFVEPLVESGCRVIGFDAPGHGRSSGTQSSLTEITRAMQTIGTAHGPFRAVVGHSFGGICTAVALQEGLAAERAVRVASPATLEWLTQQFAQRLRLPTPVVRQLNRRSAKRIGQNNWHRLYHDQQASSLEHPALILHDRDDDVVPWRQGKAFAQSWRHAQFRLTEGLGHRRILRDPSVLQEVVRFVLKNPDPV